MTVGRRMMTSSVLVEALLRVVKISRTQECRRPRETPALVLHRSSIKPPSGDIATPDAHHRFDFARPDLRNLVHHRERWVGICLSAAMLEMEGRTLRVTTSSSLIYAVRFMKKPIDTDCGVVVVVAALVFVFPAARFCSTLK